ncbi:MAG: endonuclease YncB(thermonuclease family) [Planctomycetota bacterium]|jgi:endonuclease YncB( thermonuclease family)
MAITGLLSLIFVLLVEAPARGQVFHWLDQKNKSHQTTVFAEIPQYALPSLRCTTKILDVPTGQQVIVEGGHRIQLIGVDAPDGPLSWDGTIARLAKHHLETLAKGKEVEIKFDRNFKNAKFETLGYVWSNDGTFLNTSMIAAGLAAPLATDQNARFAKDFEQAGQKARRAKKGMWQNAKASPELSRKRMKGFSLGLYSRDAAYDYTPLLKEQVAIGATDVLLVTPWFLEHHKSCEIVPKKHRSTPLPMVARAARQARELGLRVAIMPIVLLWKPEDDHWRGNIEPRDADDWFLNYQEFIGAFASLAEQAGAAELVVGSEFSSLERDEEHWREVIRGVRGRFHGTLSYSANWDHLTVIQFWDALDAIGMTGYHSLTKKNDPSIPELVLAWRKVRTTLEKELKYTKKPYFFSEMGYASLDGINKNPWDYVSPKVIDWQEQADCYEAYLQVWEEASTRFLGAFFYTWWRNKDSDDKRQYTVYGKPAEDVIRKWFNAK